MVDLYKAPPSKRVSAREVRELLAQPSTRHEELSKLCRAEVWLLGDGRALVLVQQGKGNLWPSAALLEEDTRRLLELESRGGIDITLELLPPIDDFLRDIDVHVSSVGARLRVPQEALDRSEASLDAVDKGIWRMAQAKRMTPEVFTPLVAYVGEVMRLARDGQWTKVPLSDGGFEPMITLRDGRFYQPVAIVLVELERGRGGSVRGAVGGTLEAHKLSPQQNVPPLVNLDPVRVTEWRLQQLVALPWVRDDARAARFGANVRTLADGRVLLFDGQGGTLLLLSSEAFDRMVRGNPEEARRRQELVRAVLPPLDEFLRAVLAHAADLGPKLGAVGVLDGTEASLDVVGSILSQMPLDRRRTREFVTPLVAYVGEMMRAATGGHWTTVEMNGGGTMPGVVTSAGVHLHPLVVVYSHLTSRNCTGLRQGVAAALKPPAW